MSLESLDLRYAALLVIDMQNAFCHEKGTLGLSGLDTQRLSAPVKPLSTLISRCQEVGVPVLWTVQEHFEVDHSRARKRLLGHTSRRKQVSALAGSWDEEIVDELKPLAAKNPSFVIKKHRFGAFYETRLEMVLKMLGTQTLFVTGTTTNACVETTIREAYLRDLDVVAIRDCIAGVRPNWESTAMEVWSHYLCALSDSPEVLDWISVQSAPRTLSYGHMLMQVRDMSAAEHFYIDLLGFTVRPAKPLADGRPFTAFRQGIALTSTAHPGDGMKRQIDHLAFEVNDVRALTARLRQSDVEFQEDLHNGPYGLTVYVTDPDGNRIELYQTGASV